MCEGIILAQRNRVNAAVSTDKDVVEMNCIHLPNFCFFPRSVLGSDGSSLPSSLPSSQSTWGALRQSLKSLSAEFAVLSDKAAQQVKPPTLPSLHLLYRDKVNDKNKCCFGNVLRADGKRMMSWKSSIFSWICCSRIE